MKKIFNWLKSAISGNKVYFGIGVGALAVYLSSSANKAFYYGIASVILLLKLLGGKLLPKKWNNLAIISLGLIFIYTFVMEVVLVRESGLTTIKGWFSSLWTKISSWLPSSSTIPN